MEDAHLTAELHLTVGEQIVVAEVYAVFDGHGGSKAAQFLKNNLYKYMKEAFDSNTWERLTEEGIFESLKECFIALNNDFYDIAESGGSTAVVALIVNGKIYIANVGDSRAMLLVNGRVIQLSKDAKPERRPVQKKGAQAWWERLFRSRGRACEWSYFNSQSRRRL